MKRIVFPDSFPSTEELHFLIQRTIELSWNTIEVEARHIEAWLDNFRGKFFNKDDEQRLALWLLYNFTFYNEKDVSHLCSVLYKKFLHYLVTNYSLGSIAEIKNMLSRICYIPAGKPSESGSFLSYIYRQTAKIGIDRFFSFEQYETESTNDDILVIIDDVTISGTQMKTFLEKYSENVQAKETLVLTLIAGEKAIDTFAETEINLLHCIELEKRDKCFSSNSMLFHNYPGVIAAAKHMVEGYGKNLYSWPLGYKNGQYCFGFYYNVPNNSLPIFWSDKDWTPIIPRKEKISNELNVWKHFDRFI